MGNSRAVRCLRDLVKIRHPDFIFLSETLVNAEKIKEISVSLGFCNNFAVDNVGRGGGLAIMWKRSIVSHVVNASNNHIDVEFLEKNRPVWRLTCFYGYLERSRRRESRDFLRSLAAASPLP